MIDPQDPDYRDTPVSNSRPVFDYQPLDLHAPAQVTLITPFFNPGDIFSETAGAIFAQSFQGWEWLIINDGSTEPASLRLLDEFRQKDPRIRVIDHEHNRGLSAARNTGFGAAQTDFVVQIDADDLIEPTAVEKWAWGLVSHPEYGFIKGYSLGFGAQEYTWTHGFHDRELFLTENPVNATGMIRKSVHAAVGGYAEEKTGGLEDWDFWLHCAAHGYWGGTIPEFHDWYRLRPAHRQRWADWNAQRIEEFLAGARLRYPALWQRGFPQFPDRSPEPITSVPLELPFQNQLRKEKKRLLLILPWLQMGGADKINLDLAGELVGRGWEVSIVTTLHGDHSWAPAFEKITPDVFILANFLQPADYPHFISYFARSRQIDAALIANSHFAYLALPYLRAELPEVTWLTLSHMELEDGVFGAYPQMAIQQQDCIDLNLTVSEHLKQTMLAHGLEAGRGEVLYANIATEQWVIPAAERAAMRHSLGIADSTPLILYSARLGAQKQPGVFMAVMRRLHAQGLEFAALVVGDGPDRPAMVQAAADYGLSERVIFAGAQPAARMPAYFGAADIFFLPSQWEGIAITLYEALAAGLPVVGAEVGGQAELVTPAVGFLVKRSNPDQEAQEYARLLACLIQDPVLRQEMGGRGRERVQGQFRLEQMVQRFEECVKLAARLHQESRRPTPDAASRQDSAVAAAEFARAVRTWQQPETTPPASSEAEYVYDPFTAETAFYRGFKKVTTPVYRWLKSHGWNFIDPLKSSLRKTLNRKN